MIFRNLIHTNPWENKTVRKYVNLNQRNEGVFVCCCVSDGSLVEGNTIQLEDGTTAFIQHVTVQQKGVCDATERCRSERV